MKRLVVISLLLMRMIGSSFEEKKSMSILKPMQNSKDYRRKAYSENTTSFIII